MDSLGLSYMAGIFDGEGTINIIRSRARRRHPESLYLQIGVTNRNEWVVRYFQAFFGAAINTDKKGCFRWNATNLKASNALTILLPYLRIKKSQAEVALLFQSRKVVGTQRNTNKTIEEADKIRIQHLNKMSGNPAT